MTLWQVTPCEELKCWTKYKVCCKQQGDLSPHYIGTYMGLKITTNGEKFYVFWNVTCVLPISSGLFMKHPSPMEFTEEFKIFKRFVSAEEMNAAYRAAFEKRAVNQIISSIVGHNGIYY